MTITWDTIIFAASAVGSVLLLGGIVFKIYDWYKKQNKQSVDIAELKARHDADVDRLNEENTLICYALSACLDGLMQLGCNHSVPDAKSKLDKYLNQQAHRTNSKGGNNHG